MITATRAIHKENTISNSIHSFIIVLLCIMVLASAFSVVYLSDLNRRLFMQYQEAQATYNQLYVDWGKLLLEQSTWSTQARIENIAQQRLDMQIPATTQIVVVK